MQLIKDKISNDQSTVHISPENSNNYQSVELKSYQQLMHAYDHMQVYKQRALDRYRPSAQQLEQRKQNQSEFLENFLLKPEEYEKFGSQCFEQVSTVLGLAGEHNINEELNLKNQKEVLGDAFRKVQKQIQEQISELNVQRPRMKKE